MYLLNYLRVLHDRICHQALAPFGMLRNMHSVAIDGAPPPFAERLKRMMLGNTPQLKNVREMYSCVGNKKRR